MSETKKTKNYITAGMRRDIAAYKAKNPHATLREIADKFGCTENNVRGAIEPNRRKKPGLARVTKKDKLNAAKNLSQNRNYSFTDMLKKQIEVTVNILDTEAISITDRAAIIEKLVRARINFDEHELQLNLKGLDFHTILETVREYDPGITELQLNQKLQEARARIEIRKRNKAGA